MNIKKLGQAGAIPVIVIIIAALVVVGGGAAYVATDGFGSNDGQQDSATTDSESTETQETALSEESSNGSVSLLENALAGGEEVKCTYSDGEYSGEAFISSNENFRVNYQYEEGTGYMIKTGDSIYVWTDTEPNGFIISTDANDEASDITEQYEEFKPENFEENYSEENIDCESTDIDPALFEIPENINFQSMSDLLQSIPQQ